MPKPLLPFVSLEEIKSRNGKMSEHILYNTWRGMKERCTSSTSIAYSRYGAKGVEIYSEWLIKKRHPQHKRWSQGFCNFLDYVENKLGPKPSGFSLDRINNKRGYAPDNLRWADASLQKKNQTVKNNAGYKYVYAVKGTNKWQAEYKNGKKRIYVGCFSTKEEAYFKALAHRLETLWPSNL